MTASPTPHLNTPRERQGWSLTPNPIILERNLAALARTCRSLTDRLRKAAPSPDISFLVADDGALTATLGQPPGGSLLASRRAPLDEARRLAEAAPIRDAAAIVVNGFALGHHVAAMAGLLKRTGVLIVYEPDLALLRAVFEHIDHSAWMTSTNLVIFTDADNAPEMAAALAGLEGLVAAGVKFVDHPPSRRRLADASQRFGATLTEFVRAVRTNVVTTLVQVEVTLRNLLMNLDRYAQAPGVVDLAGAARNRPAVVVSAGPSLERNLDLLAAPGIRDRVVIIAVQTVLKKLLSRGIKPHFVTALDYHEISRRFYEGLTAADVEGITLVAEPKANPAILEAFPGVIRCPADRVLDDALGPELARPMGELRPGATVAHLAYYLARHLGADPVILIGQDLGFTDGQYYHAGAAIHQVWSGELNDFNTLEMMEWQRIMRGKSMLHRATDILDRPIFTDEQMRTYLVQFERDFQEDHSAGRTTIDATEGGVRKRGAAVMTLADALARHAPPDAPPITLPRAVPRPVSAERLRRRVRDLLSDTTLVEHESRRVCTMLAEMAEHHADQARVNRLIGLVDTARDRVLARRDAYALVQFLNQTGSFNRFKADRALELDDHLPALERQKRQIERDLTNVTWLADAAAQLSKLLTLTARVLDGAPRVTTDPDTTAPADTPPTTDLDAPAPRRVVAFVAADFDRTGLGARRAAIHELDAPIPEHASLAFSPLALTLRRLSAFAELNGVVLITSDIARCRRAIADAHAVAPFPAPFLEHLHVEPMPESMRARVAAMAPARLWARHAWRAGLGGAAAWDEALHAPTLDQLMERFHADAAAVLAADWCLVDPALGDECTRRHRAAPHSHPITFAHAPAGLSPVVLDRSVIRELAERQNQAGAFATLGALLGYIPIAPQADPITKPVCVQTSPALRDLGWRLIADTRSGLDAVVAAMQSLTDPAAGAELSLRLPQLLASREHDRAERLELSITDDSSADALVSLCSLALQQLTPGAAPGLTIRISGRALEAAGPALAAFCRRALEAGAAAIHIRTDLACSPAAARSLLDVGAAVVSVDVASEHDATRAALAAPGSAAAVIENLCTLVDSRPWVEGLPRLWVVPRITRRDEVYAEIESFYDRWLMAAGACVIDPLAAPVAGARIAPLPPPSAAARRLGHKLVVAP